MFKYFIFVLLLVSSSVFAEPRVRPDHWGQQIIGTQLENLYLIDKGVYRSEQPGHENIIDLKHLGIKEVLNLREFHNDKDDLKGSNLLLNRVKMNAGKVNQQQLVDALRIIKNRNGPVLLHCWHGSDRTGATVAAYRIVFNNWSKAQAIDEMVNGGYGYHKKVYPQLIPLIENLNVFEIKKELNINLLN